MSLTLICIFFMLLYKLYFHTLWVNVIALIKILTENNGWIKVSAQLFSFGLQNKSKKPKKKKKRFSAVTVVSLILDTSQICDFHPMLCKQIRLMPVQTCDSILSYLALGVCWCLQSVQELWQDYRRDPFVLTWKNASVTGPASRVSSGKSVRCDSK